MSLHCVALSAREESYWTGERPRSGRRPTTLMSRTLLLSHPTGFQFAGHEDLNLMLARFVILTTLLRLGTPCQFGCIELPHDRLQSNATLLGTPS